MKEGLISMATMDRLEGLINLEIEGQRWTLILESQDGESGGVMAPGLNRLELIKVLKRTIDLLEKNHEKENSL